MRAPEGGLGSPPSAQDLALDLLGLHVLGRAQRKEEPPRLPVPMQAFLTVLRGAGIADSATRTALNRLVTRGVLSRHRRGRTSAFELTDDAMALVHRGRARLFSPRPFDHPDDLWTVLDCPIPESRRNLRYHLHIRLAWAGFGMLRTNLWIAPGRVDVGQLLGDLVPAPSVGLVHAFHGVPTPPTDIDNLIRSAWDLPALRSSHLAFTARWQGDRPPVDPLPEYLLLLADWGHLLRADPGLPAVQLDAEWPAERSAQVFRRLDAELGPRAEAQLEQLVP